MRISRENLSENMVLETLNRGENDLGLVINVDNRLYVQFNDCTLQIQSYFNKNLMAKGFEGDHVVSIRMASEHKHFLFPKTAPLICSRTFSSEVVINDPPIKKKKLHR